MTVISVATEIGGNQWEFIDNEEEIIIKSSDTFSSELIINTDDFSVLIEELIKYRDLRNKEV